MSCIAVVLSLTRSRFTLALQSVFLVLNGLSVFLAVLYNAKTPDLYPNNAHHKIGWIITLVVCAHVFVNFIGRVASVLATRRARSSPQPIESLAFLNSSSRSLGNDFPYYESARHSDESFDAASPTAHSFRTSSASTAFDESAHVSQERFKEYNTEDCQDIHADLPTLPKDARKPKFPRVWKSIFTIYGIVDRIILPFGFVALTTGIVTFARFFVSADKHAPLVSRNSSLTSHRRVITSLAASLIGLRAAFSSGWAYLTLVAGQVALPRLAGHGIVVQDTDNLRADGFLRPSSWKAL